MYMHTFDHNVIVFCDGIQYAQIELWFGPNDTVLHTPVARYHI